MATRRLAAVLATVLAAAGGGAAVGARAPAARIVAEWEPGLSADDVGGRITVDGYGVGGLGLYRLDDGVLAVCVQADIGHALDADYRRDGTPAVSDARLAYLLWRYGSAEASDVEAAALNALSWRYADAQRRGGGPVWTGDDVEIGIDGGRRLADVEAAVAALGAEAAARRGPWELVDLAVSPAQDGTDIRVALRGPGGPVAGVEVRIDAGGSSSTAATDAEGVATVRRAGPVAGLVVASASGPGPLVTWSAPGSQRLAVAGSPLVARDRAHRGPAGHDHDHDAPRTDDDADHRRPRRRRRRPSTTHADRRRPPPDDDPTTTRRRGAARPAPRRRRHRRRRCRRPGPAGGTSHGGHRSCSSPARWPC